MSLLQYLKDENILELFLVNCSTCRDNHSMPCTIDTSFYWAETNEGGDFWQQHNDNCKACLTQKEIQHIIETYPEYFI